MKRTRFCLIGTGRAGRVHAQNLARRIPSAQLAAICDTSPQSLQEVGEEYAVSSRFQDYHEAVSQADVDAVVIVTPTFLHCAIACAAAEAGKHVFLEKPMAVTVAECREILAAVQRAGVKLQLGFMRRFDEGFLQAQQLVASGELGQVMKIKSIGRGPGLPPPWIYDLSKSNGIIAEVNSHDLDSLRWLSGSEVTSVYAQAANFKCLDAREQYPQFYDNVLATFRLASGTLGEVDGTCPCHYGYDARVEILCERGLLLAGTVAQQGVTRVSVDGQVLGRAVKSWRTLFKDAYLAEMEHFIECIERDRPPRVTGLDGLRAVQLVSAVNRSIQSGQPVSLAEEDLR